VSRKICAAGFTRNRPSLPRARGDSQPLEDARLVIDGYEEEGQALPDLDTKSDSRAFQDRAEIASHSSQVVVLLRGRSRLP
jgi:hypothetical protein